MRSSSSRAPVQMAPQALCVCVCACDEVSSMMRVATEQPGLSAPFGCGPEAAHSTAHRCSVWTAEPRVEGMRSKSVAGVGDPATARGCSGEAISSGNRVRGRPGHLRATGDPVTSEEGGAAGTDARPWEQSGWESPWHAGGAFTPIMTSVSPMCVLGFMIMIARRYMHHPHTTVRTCNGDDLLRSPQFKRPRNTP